MKDNSKLVMPSAVWLEELAKENIRIIKGFSKAKDPAKTRKLLTLFIKSFVENVVLQTLAEAPSGPNPTKQELYDFVSKNFMGVKYDIQNDLAEGLSRALSRYSGKQVDYYCQLLPTPPAINKQPC